MDPDADRDAIVLPDACRICPRNPHAASDAYTDTTCSSYVDCCFKSADTIPHGYCRPLATNRDRPYP